MQHTYEMNHHYTFDEFLVNVPMVSDDAPDWKKICPFCGELGGVHEIDDTHVCHFCHANWIEHDTDTERQIQILYLNGAKMPKFGEGYMPLVESKIYNDFNFIAEVNFNEGTITFTEEGFNEYVKHASNF